MMPRRTLGLTLVIAGIGLMLDQATKAIATASLELGERIPILGDVLGLSLVYNPGAAFSLGAGSTWILTVLAIAAACATVWFTARLSGAGWGVALGLILGGTTGNLVDRLVNPPSFGQGHVTDFIAYGGLFVGNVADILLVSGVGLVFILLFARRPAESREATRRDMEPEDVPAGKSQ